MNHAGPPALLYDVGNVNIKANSIIIFNFISPP
jgi:hypothetical protein